MITRKFISRVFLPSACFLLVTGWALGETESFEPSKRQESPRVSDISFLPGEKFRLEFEAPPGDYEIEFSQDLTTWTHLSNVAPSLGLGQFEDKAFAGQPKGFYRVRGSFSSADYHVLTPSFGIEFSGSAAEESTGNLWLRFADESAILQQAGAETGLAVFPRSGFLSDGRVSPLGDLALPAGRLLSIARQTERDNEAIDFIPGGWNSTLPGVFGIPNELFGNLFSEGSRIVSLSTMEGDRDSLVGLSQRRTAITLVPDATEFLFGRRDVVLPLMARKSVDADPSRMDGPWGFVRFMVEAEAESVRYSGGAYTLEVNAGDGKLDFLRASEMKAEQTIPAGGTVLFESVDTPLDLRFPFTLDHDGTFGFTADGGPDLRGFVSPSAKLFVVGRSVPDRSALKGGETIVVDDQATALEFQYGIGLRRDIEPQFAGRTYLIVHHGFWVSDGWFDVGMKPRPRTERLTFSADGSSASRFVSATFFRTSFEGEAYEAQDSAMGNYEYHSVSTDPDGKITLLGRIADEPEITVSLLGFAQEEGRLLVLIDSVETAGDGIGIGMLIGILQEDEESP